LRSAAGLVRGSYGTGPAAAYGFGGAGC
jgi:hypothetical protein